MTMSRLARWSPALLALLSACNAPGAPRAAPPAETEEAPEDLPQPPPYGPFFIAPNMDDDNGNGAADYYETTVQGDDEVYVFEVPPDLFALSGSAIGLAASGDVVNMTIRHQGKKLFGLAPDDPCPKIPVTGADLEVQMSRPGRFVTLTFHLLDDNDTSIASESVRIASAPVFLNHHLQETERVWVTKAGWPAKAPTQPAPPAPPVNNTVENIQMVTRLSALLGGRLTTLDAGQLGNDIWVQDELETATATAVHDNVRLDVALSSPRNRELDQFVKGLGAPDFAVVDLPGSGSTYDSFGNLETSPPVSVGGVDYPYGRIYYGSKIDVALKSALQDQGTASVVVQKPFEIDVSWLEVGHIDEIVTILPDPASAKGFRLLVASPARAIEILKNLDPASKLPLYDKAYNLPTVGDFLAQTSLLTFNENLETTKLAAARATFKAELGLSDSDIYPVPVLFVKQSHTKALTSGLVNLLLVNTAGQAPLAVAPDPFFRADVGDKVDPWGDNQAPGYDPMKIGDQSTDPFIADLAAALPPGMTLEVVDDWMYHRADGEVHCGTNSQRKPWQPGGMPWWQAVPLPPLAPAPWTCGCQPQVYGTPPAFVGTPSPTSGGALDWAALDQELITYADPQNLAFTVKVPYEPGNGCGSISFQLPVPCGAASYTDYTIWRMGGAVAVFLVQPQLPQLFNDWLHNPGFYAEGMMDPFYTHPAKSVAVACQGLGVGFCAIGSYGAGTDDTALIPSDLARTDPSPGPMQPGAGAYNGKVRAFPVHQRAQPDPALPPGYDLCHDNVDLHAQGGGIQGTCQNNGLDHGAIYLMFQATEKVCAAP